MLERIKASLPSLAPAEQRVARAAQPRLAQLQRAIAKDISRIGSATVSDTPALLVRIDELLRMADELPLANAVAEVSAGGSLKRADTESWPSWWQRGLRLVGEEARNLLRVSRIDQPEAALLAPEQAFFLRENLKLRLLNARLGLLSRQTDNTHADLASASAWLGKYFDPASRKTQTAVQLLAQVQSQLKNTELPRLDDTLAALTTAAAGR